MKVITIDREFGAGGHSVGRAVAAKLGIEFYDRDIIKEAAATSGVTPEQLEREEETLSGGTSFINAIIPMAYDVKDVVYKNESEIIRQFAAQGPCVILGRCGSAVLRDAGVETLDVFLFGEPKDRMARAGELMGLTDPDDILSGMNKRDKRRKAYFEYYTDRSWGVCGEYDLCLNTGTLGFDFCVDLICKAALED